VSTNVRHLPCAPGRSLPCLPRHQICLSCRHHSSSNRTPHLRLSHKHLIFRVNCLSRLPHILLSSRPVNNGLFGPANVCPLMLSACLSYSQSQHVTYFMRVFFVNDTSSYTAHPLAHHSPYPLSHLPIHPSSFILPRFTCYRYNCTPASPPHIFQFQPAT
jgi:hypothetical protein